MLRARLFLNWIPFVVILLLLGMFLVVAPTSPLAPFIYWLFVWYAKWMHPAMQR